MCVPSLFSRSNEFFLFNLFALGGYIKNLNIGSITYLSNKGLNEHY